MAAQGARLGAGAAPEEDRDRQGATFGEGEAGPPARHPGRFIVACGGEAFVGDADGEALSRADAARPGRPLFLRMRYPQVA